MAGVNNIIMVSNLIKRKKKATKLTYEVKKRSKYLSKVYVRNVKILSEYREIFIQIRGNSI